MGVNPATFSSAGQISQHYIPGAYSRRNFVANEGGGVSSGNICIMGYSELGKPNELLVFGSGNEARAELSAGAGLEGVIAAFTPGNDLKPQEVGFIRVNDGVQSSLTLLKAAADVFTVKSFSYGVPMNQIRLKFSTGTTGGTHKIETEYKGDEFETDDIEKKSFSLQYTGAGTVGVMTINATTLATTITGGPGGEELALTLADYPTIDELVAVINNNAAYSATVLTDTPTESSEEIDAVTAIDILTNSYTVKSDYQAVYEALVADSLIDSVTKEGIIRSIPDYDADFVYLSGGTSGAYTTTEFTASLLILEEEDIQLISTVSEESSVHALIKNHCVDMNSIEGRKERQFYVGGALSEDEDAIKIRAAQLNSSFGSLCSPGFYQFDSNGDEKLYSPAYFACKQVGMVSALGLNNPTTSKQMDVLRWEKVYGRTSKNNLIKGGVLIGAKDEDGLYITIRSLTTYQGASLQQNEASIMRETLYQDADLRKRVGRALTGTPNLGVDQLATVDSIFERTIQDWKGLGIIVANGSKLYSGFTRKIVGDQIVVEYNTWNTAPTNFIFITHNISVLIQ